MALALMGLAACASSNPPAVSPVPESSPRLMPGDAIRVQVWREADLSGLFAVDDRGIVTFPLLGERSVVDYSPDALRDTLMSEYRHYLQNPSIEVTPLRRISILGAVRSPGLYPVDLTVSLADAIALAGGIISTGDPDRIQLVRNNTVVAQGIDGATTIGAADIRSGDQIVVGESSWLARNGAVVLGSAIAAAAIIAAAMITN